MVLTLAAKKLLPLRAFATNLGGNVLDGDTVKVPVVKGIVGTVRTKVKKQNYESDEVEPSMVDVSLTDRAYVSVCLPQEFVDARNRLQAAGADVEAAIAEQIVDDLLADFWTKIWSRISIANVARVIWSGDPATFGYDDMVQINKDKRAVFGSGPRFNLVLNADFEAALLQDSTIIANPGAPGLGREVMTTAKVPGVGGINAPLFGDVIPDNTEQLAGVAVKAGGSGLAVAMAPVSSACKVGEGGLTKLQTLRDGVTGLQITYRQICDAKADVRQDIWEIRWGAKIIDADAICRVVDTTLV